MQKHLGLFFCSVLSFGALLPNSSFADTLIDSGTLSFSGPTYNHPISFTELATQVIDPDPTPVPIIVPYSAYSFTLSDDDTISLRVDSVGFADGDSYMTLYAGDIVASGFDPSQPLTNLVAFNDDFSGGLSGIDFVGTAGIIYTVVTSTFFDTPFSTPEEGDYSTSVAAPTATVTAVPEPSTYALIGVGLAALFAAHLSKRRKA